MFDESLPKTGFDRSEYIIDLGAFVIPRKDALLQDR